MSGPANRSDPETRFTHSDQAMEMVRLLARIESGVSTQTRAIERLADQLSTNDEGATSLASAVNEQAVTCAVSREAMDAAAVAMNASTSAVREITGSLKSIRWILAAQGSLMLILILVVSLLAGVRSEELRELIGATHGMAGSAVVGRSTPGPMGIP